MLLSGNERQVALMKHSAMVLAGIELVFFVEAHTILYFGFFFCENNGDNTPVLLVFAQRLHRAKDFFASYSTLPLRRLAVHKLGEDTGRTAEVN